MRRVLLACVVMAGTAPAHHAVADIKVTTEEYPPYNMTQNGVIVGLATDLVRAAFEKAEIGYTIESLPWQRAYQAALTAKDTCVYSTTQTEERLPLFEWVGPLAKNNWTLFARAESTLSLATLDDAKGLLIGGYQGDAVSIFLEKQGFRVEAVSRDELNPAKLANGRIDLWATGSELGPFLAEQQGIKGLKPLLTFKESLLSMACNKNTDPATLAKLRAALDEVKARKP